MAGLPRLMSQAVRASFRQNIKPKDCRQASDTCLCFSVFFFIIRHWHFHKRSRSGCVLCLLAYWTPVRSSWQPNLDGRPAYASVRYSLHAKIQIHTHTSSYIQARRRNLRSGFYFFLLFAKAKVLCLSLPLPWIQSSDDRKPTNAPIRCCRFRPAGSAQIVGRKRFQTRSVRFELCFATVGDLKKCSEHEQSIVYSI